MRLTYPTTLVLQALLHGHHHGFDIMDATGLPSGTVDPILRRLDGEGCVRSHWEPAGEARKEHTTASIVVRATRSFMPVQQWPFGSMTFVDRGAADGSALIEPMRQAI